MKQHPLIENQSQFKGILEKARARTEEMARLGSSFALPSVIAPQLDLIAGFLAENRAPVAEDRARLTIGVLAVRNFEDADPAYAGWLMSLDYAFKNWEKIAGVNIYGSS